MRLIVEMKTGMIHDITTTEDLCLRCLGRGIEEERMIDIEDASGEQIVLASEYIMSIRVIPDPE
jgi:hypothetical protein